MKSNRIYNLLCLLTVLLCMQACNKYLEQEPDNRTEINTVSKVAQLVATAYPARDYFTFTEAASDNSEDKGVGIGTTSEVSVNPYYWQDVIGTPTGSAGNYWKACYSAISSANQALEAINVQNLGSAVLPYKGEALVARAYNHFMLVTFFAKAYQIGGANDSPGIPYVTEPETEVIKQYDRGTVKSTYQKIEQDLVEGMALLSANAYSVPKYHFTPVAAHAFASRFYLFKGDWEKVIEHVSAIEPTGNFIPMLRPVNTTFQNMTYDEFRLAFTRSDVNANLLLANQYSLIQRQHEPRYGFGVGLLAMFSVGGNYSGKPLANQTIRYDASNYATYKYKEHLFNSEPYIMTPLLTVDEALMNRAEAYVQLNQLDNSIKDITAFLSVRIRGYSAATDAPTIAKTKTFYAIDNDKDAVIKLILQSKKAEFLHEGIRWFDILRHRLTVKHSVFSASGQESIIELTADDNRRVFQIPEQALLSGVSLNPR